MSDTEVRTHRSQEKERERPGFSVWKYARLKGQGKCLKMSTRKGFQSPCLCGWQCPSALCTSAHGHVCLQGGCVSSDFFFSFQKEKFKSVQSITVREEQTATRAWVALPGSSLFPNRAGLPLCSQVLSMPCASLPRQRCF
jgi:hypothetical protein